MKRRTFGQVVVDDALGEGWAAAGGAAGNAQNVMAIEMLMRHAPEGYRE